MIEGQQLVIYACLPIYEKYRDRYQMFAAMAETGAQVRMLLLHGSHPPAANFPTGFQQLSLPEGTSLLNRGKHIRKLLTLAPPPARTIIHDTFTSQMGFYLRHRWKLRSARVHNVLSLYNPNPSYLFGGHLRFTPGSRNRWANSFWWLRSYLPLVMLEGLSCQLADVVTGNSPQIVEEVCSYYRIPQERTKFIPAEINSEFFCPGPCRRRHLNLPEDSPLILYVGNIERRKGLDVFLNSVAALANAVPSVRGVVVGRFLEPDRRWFDDLCRRPELAGRVELRGSVPQETVRDYYRSCNLLFFPTRHEGSPRAVKESIACGCPVVGPSVPPLRAIDPEGRAILYTSGYEPGDCAEAMRKMLDPVISAPRIQFGLDLVKNYSPNKIALQFLDLYETFFHSHPISRKI